MKNKMRILLYICLWVFIGYIAIVGLSLLIGNKATTEETDDEVIETVEPLIIDNNEETSIDEVNTKTRFQDKYSMDWGSADACNLLKIATFKGGTTETKAYNIIVTLNRVFDNNYPNNIMDVVCDELYNYHKVSPYDYESIVPDEDSSKALQMIYDGWDETNGSLEYKN